MALAPWGPLLRITLFLHKGLVGHFHEVFLMGKALKSCGILRLILRIICYNNYIIRVGVVIMPNIKPVSDLRNYAEVLRDISVGEPVFLTRNGRGRYVLIDIEDYEKTNATIKLLTELSKVKSSADDEITDLNKGE